MLLFMLVCVLKTVATLDQYNNGLYGNDCATVCQNINLPKLEFEKYEQVVCQRGCRFYNMHKYKDELNPNGTIKECHNSCLDSYPVTEENECCNKGCDEMAKKWKIEIPFLIISPDDDVNTIVLAEPDMEILETEMSDPSIKSQLEIGFNIDYKIPETHIRTMPIRFSETRYVEKESSDWLDCASRNSGIPRWILVSAILSAILVALWLSVATKQVDDEPIVDVDVSDIGVLVGPIGDVIDEKADFEVTIPNFQMKWMEMKNETV